MSDRDTAGGTAFPSGSFEDAMAGFDTATGSPRGATEVTAVPSFPTPMGGQPEEAMGQGQEQGEGQGMGATGGAAEKAKEVAGQAQEKATAAVDTAKEKVGQVTDQATSKVDVGMDKAAGGLATLAGTLREKSEGMGQQGGATGAVQTAATTAAESLDTAAQYLREKDTDQLMAELEALVRRKPAQSLLVAAGVGFLLSKALR